MSGLVSLLQAVERRPGAARAAGVLVALALAAGVGWRAWALGRQLPLGPDGGLWAMAARVRAEGQPVALPPLYPTLVGLLGGAHPVDAALLLNAAAVGATVLLVGEIAGAATRGAPASARLVGTLLAALGLHGGMVAAQVQPEAVTALALTALVWAGARAVAAPTPAGFAVWGAAAGLAFCAREHGQVAGGVALLAAAAVPGPGRGARLLAFAAAAQLVGVAVAGDAAGLARVAADGVGRAAAHVQESVQLGAGQPLSGGPADMDSAARSSARGLGLLGVMARRTLVVAAPEAAVLLGAAWALVRLVRAGRLALAAALVAPLASLAAALVVWTQWRHFLVVGGAGMGVALVGLGLGLDEAPTATRARRLAGALAVGVLLAGPEAWLGARRLAALGPTRPTDAADVAAAAAYVREHAAADDLVAGDPRVAALTGLLPSPVPPGTPDRSLPTPAAGWRTWIVAPRVLAEGPWRRQARFGALEVYRAEPPGPAEPACLRGTPRPAMWAGYPLLRRGPEVAPVPSSQPACAPP